MPDSGATEAERRVQPQFSFATLLGGLLIFAALAVFHVYVRTIPNRSEAGAATPWLELRPVAIGARSFGPLQVAGAWEIDSDDQRVGGLSALAVDEGELVAVTDSGVVVRFAKPRPGGGRIRASVGELPAGPGTGRFKRDRDSEALARAASGDGWWVAFENYDELWLYDHQFRRPLRRVPLDGAGWGANKGVEGATDLGDRLLLFPETGDRVVELRGKRAREFTLVGSRGRVSDAAGDAERLFAIERRLTPLGFVNALLLVARGKADYRVVRRIPLPLRRSDNVEGVAIERRDGAPPRLWLATDDNFQPPLRSLLIAVDLTAPL